MQGSVRHVRAGDVRLVAGAAVDPVPEGKGDSPPGAARHADLPAQGAHRDDGDQPAGEAEGRSGVGVIMADMGATAHGRDVSGRRAIFLLFLGLWVATLVTLVAFGLVAVDRFGPLTGRRVWVALVVDLMLPLIAWQAFRWMNQHRDRRAE